MLDKISDLIDKVPASEWILITVCIWWTWFVYDTFKEIWIEDYNSWEGGLALVLIGLWIAGLLLVWLLKLAISKVEDLG